MSKEMKWTLQKVTIGDIAIRKRKNPYTKNEEEYAVVKVSLEDRWDTFRMAHTRYKKERPICLMCFREEIFKRLVIGETFSFGGRTNFPPGNTYHQITHAFDSLGFDIESEQSTYFAFSSSPEEDCEEAEKPQQKQTACERCPIEEYCDHPCEAYLEGDYENCSCYIN